jgi:hypothetical protein
MKIVASIAAVLTLLSGAAEAAPPPWQQLDEKQVRAAESELVRRLRKAPEDPAALESLSRLYGENQGLPGVSPELLKLVQRSADPVRFVLRVRGIYAGAPVTRDLAAAALKVRPGQPLLWVMAARGAGASSPWRAAYLEQALRLTKEETSDAAVAIAGTLLEAELKAGLTAEALTTYRSLPAGLRSRIASGPLPAVSGDLGDLIGPFTPSGTDLRTDLILAYLLAGDVRAAAELEKTLPPLPARTAAPWLTPPGQERKAGQGAEARRRLIDFWLRPAKSADAFERLTEALPMLSVWRGQEHAILARLARREGYPALAAYLYDRWGKVRKAHDRTYARPGGLPPRVEATARRLENAEAAFGRFLEAEAAASRKIAPEPPWEVTTAALEAIAGDGSFLIRKDVVQDSQLDVFLDRSGKRAYAIWSKPMQGAEMRLEESGGAWKVEFVSDWIA